MRTRTLLTSTASMMHPPPPISISVCCRRRRLPLPTLLSSRPCLSSTSSYSTDVSPDRIARPLVPAPKEGSGPLMSRRPDRELPDIRKRHAWVKTLPLFVLLVAASSLAIFNYQKSSSSTVNSILYALRTNDHARDLLGDEIYFASKVPWIRGVLSPLQGTIDISFWVKGNKSTAQTRFVSVRRRKDGFFETLEWSLRTPDGREIQLLELEGAKDPISGADV